MASSARVVDGQCTQTVYTLIKTHKFVEAIDVLSEKLQAHTRSRAALSLLGYCYYQVQDYAGAAECYEQLVQLYPEVEEYKVYYAQSLYKSVALGEAMKATFFATENPDTKAKMIKLQAAIKYAEEDYVASRALVEQAPADEVDTDINLGCLLFKEKRYEEALGKFQHAIDVLGKQPDLCYNMALCYFMLKQESASLKIISDIIEQTIQDHPELGIGMGTEGVEMRSVGNTQLLQETYTVEAFNLKAAIEYQTKNYALALEALTDMPPRAEEELDSITLHNQALMNMEAKPTAGFERLQFLLQQNPFPPETFGNLLLLYCKYEYYDLAADVLAENSHLTFKLLSPFLYEFIEAIITLQTSSEEAFRRFDEMAGKQTDQMQRCTKEVQEARVAQDAELVKKGVAEYDELMEKYVPVLMHQARIYWTMENYPALEKVFRRSVNFCQGSEVWKLNVAHVLFMQEKYKDAINFYEPIVKNHFDNILGVSAIVLANLCVSYIMTSKNEEAEELMRKIEKEEEHISYEEPDRKLFHLCIVNLVIGTLYCAKGNYEFGISRIMKSLEPYNRKLGTDTWYYAKRCFLSLMEAMAKQMVFLQDSTVEEIIQFFEHVEEHGRHVQTVVEQPLEQEPMHAGKNTVTYESRRLKSLFMQIIGQ